MFGQFKQRQKGEINSNICYEYHEFGGGKSTYIHKSKRNDGKSGKRDMIRVRICPLFIHLLRKWYA